MISSMIVPRGVFSRIYRHSSHPTFTVTYNTLARTVTQFEGDSAEVWQHIFDAGGNPDSALEYICCSGQYDQNHTQKLLEGFLVELVSMGLLCEQEISTLPPSFISDTETNIIDMVDPNRNIEQAIGQNMADNRILYSLVLELTYRCNERCLHCYCPEQRETNELSLSTIESLLDEFIAAGGFHLQLTGGEPLLRPDIRDLLKMLASKPLILNLTSNLTLVDDELLDLIIATYPRSVGCSIYAAKPELHDAITQLPGSFEKTMSAVKRLRQNHVPVVLKAPLMRHTVGEWRAIEQLARKYGCEYQFDLNITARNDGGLAPIDLRVRDTEAIRDLFSSRYYRIYLGDEPADSLFSPSPDAMLCGAGGSGLTISPDGTIRPCIGLMTPIGNYPADQLATVWNHSSFFDEWEKLRWSDVSECNGCDKARFCSRCPGAWHAEHGSFMRPNEYTCYLAKIWQKC